MQREEPGWSVCFVCQPACLGTSEGHVGLAEWQRWTTPQTLALPRKKEERSLRSAVSRALVARKDSPLQGWPSEHSPYPCWSAPPDDTRQRATGLRKTGDYCGTVGALARRGVRSACSAVSALGLAKSYGRVFYRHYSHINLCIFPMRMPIAMPWVSFVSQWWRILASCSRT